MCVTRKYDLYEMTLTHHIYSLKCVPEYAILDAAAVKENNNSLAATLRKQSSFAFAFTDLT